MRSEICQSIIIIRTIHKHLAEENCIHDIHEIMQEALENNGLRPTTSDADDDTVTIQRNQLRDGKQ
jgi:hypothetical protein